MKQAVSFEAGESTGDHERVGVADTRDVDVRNLDVTRSHRVAVAVQNGDGVALDRSVYLRQGGAERAAGTVPAGRYDVTVTVDGARELHADVDLRGEDRRLLVAVGNGLVHVGDDGAL